MALSGKKYKFGVLFEVVRPFTLLAPATGIFMGGIMAMSWIALKADTLLWMKVLIGAEAAALLNGASNAINQLYDLENDRINKPERPYPSGLITARGLIILSALLAVVSLAQALWLGLNTFLIYFLAFAFTCAYSAPPLRLKKFTFLSNLAIAIPRGVLLPVAGWSIIARVSVPDPWLVGAVFGLYTLGAATTKDFPDVEGDKAAGCNTLPCRFGRKNAAIIISPFLFLPWTIFILSAMRGLLRADHSILALTGAVLSVWGILVAIGVIRSQSEITSRKTLLSWINMYLMMLFAQAGTAISYYLNNTMVR